MGRVIETHQLLMTNPGGSRASTHPTFELSPVLRKELDMMGCLDYRMNRRAVLQASLASILGFSMRDLIARAGTEGAASA